MLLHERQSLGGALVLGASAVLADATGLHDGVVGGLTRESEDAVDDNSLRVDRLDQRVDDLLTGERQQECGTQVLGASVTDGGGNRGHDVAPIRIRGSAPAGDRYRPCETFYTLVA